jgi:serine/threonine-protein kinase RsbW
MRSVELRAPDSVESGVPGEESAIDGKLAHSADLDDGARLSSSKSGRAEEGRRLTGLPVERKDLPLRLRQFIPTTRPALNRAVRAVMRIARDCGCAADERADLEIALREALANAMIHGNSLERAKRVFLRCYAGPGPAMLIVVRDEGSGFDPRGVPDPRAADRLHLRNGRGLLLMRELMDHLEYRKGGREVLLWKSPSRVRKRS